MMLAKILGAPPGVKGISLFLVPKKRLKDDGTLEPQRRERGHGLSQIGLSRVSHYAAQYGENDDCRGFLVGEPHKGLSYMFQMMNEARIGVGMQATAITSAAYYASLNMPKSVLRAASSPARTRRCLRFPIIEHADIRRMLLFQRAVSEGSLSVILQCSMYTDLARTNDPEKKERYERSLTSLHPWQKATRPENGIIAVSQGLQILGVTFTAGIPPGSNTIAISGYIPFMKGPQAYRLWTLLGRKVVMKNGQALRLYFEEVQSAVQAAMQHEVLRPYAERLKDSLEKLQSVTMHRVQFAMQGDGEVSRDATLLSGTVRVHSNCLAVAYPGVTAQHGLETDCSALDKQFYEGKLQTMRYFFHYELPKTYGLAARLMESDGLTVEMSRAAFED